MVYTNYIHLPVYTRTRQPEREKTMKITEFLPYQTNQRRGGQTRRLIWVPRLESVGTSNLVSMESVLCWHTHSSLLNNDVRWLQKNMYKQWVVFNNVYLFLYSYQFILVTNGCPSCFTSLPSPNLKKSIDWNISINPEIWYTYTLTIFVFDFQFYHFV